LFKQDEFMLRNGMNNGVEVGARKLYVCTILALVWRTRRGKKTH